MLSGGNANDESFLELSYIATSILAIGAVCVAPELMRFLYTEKYASSSFGITVFIIYILVDVISVLNITLILSAAGKTKTILFASIGAFFANIILNVGLFWLMGEVGPAVTTLLVTFVQGIVILSLGAKEIKTSILKMFDIKYLLLFIVQNGIFIIGVSMLRKLMVDKAVHYMIILFACYATYVLALLAINRKRLLNNVTIIGNRNV